MTIRTAVVGVGAIGGTLGGYMTKNGEDVLLIDEWKEHVDTMNKNGLKLDGITGESTVKVKAVHTDEIPNISGEVAKYFSVYIFINQLSAHIFISVDIYSYVECVDIF